MTIGVVMPAFEEERHISRVLAGVPSEILGHDVVVIVVDDGSTDRTAGIARRAGAEVIELGANQGKGMALRAGMKALAAHDPAATVWMDSDGQHAGSAIDDLVAPILDATADLVVGSRYLGDDHPHRAPLNRRMVRRICIAAIRLIGQCAITDPFSGFRAFSPRAVDVVDLVGDRYESELESCFSVGAAGFTVMEVPIPRIYGPHTSKMTHGTSPLRGRWRVLSGYGRTMYRAWSVS